MTSLFTVNVLLFIHSCITLSFEVQIYNRLLHSALVVKTPSFHPKALKTFPEHQHPRESTRTETNTYCPSARTLDPSPIKAYLGSCNMDRWDSNVNLRGEG